jgi:hypothetical protein
VKTLRALMWTSGSVIVLGLLGCYPRETVYVAQPRVEAVVVREAPPKIIKERRPPRPSQGHIWIDGHWHWDNKRYAWQPGRWERPPHERAVWVPPRYERDNRGYRYTPGGWGERQQAPPRQDQQRRGRP